MQPIEVIVAVANRGATRLPWTAPKTRRLATSAAESNAAGSFDASELLS